MRYRVAAAGAVAAVLAVLTCGTAHADPQAPQVGAGCPAELDGSMTLLPDEVTYVVCQEQPGGSGGFAWASVQTPFDPNDSWLSYGPPIHLHGQGMRNPNVTSGNWTATPLDPSATCRAEEQTVVEAGVLSEPEVFEGEQGMPLAVPMLPKLFYLKLSGHCLWTRN